ncbi:MAG: long-chain fatty acid--CoA ligase [Clostridia bacterium]|nr:MAG: long-chain fatty acid--CoA ligase [Clostridia bacterium]
MAVVLEDAIPAVVPHLNRVDTLPGLFVDRVKKYGDRVALRKKDLGIWQEISWYEYYLHVRYFCLGLVSLGLQKGDRVSILGDNCPEWLYADLAVQSVGGMAVGIYPTNPAPEVKYILEHSESRFVVVYDQEQLDKVLEVKADLPYLERAIVIDTKGLRHYDDPIIISFAEVEKRGQTLDKGRPELFDEILNTVSGEDVAVMIYTSGTTGAPKGAMLTHCNLLHAAEQWPAAMELFESDTVVSYLPLCHILERCMSLVVALRIGYTVNFAESTDTVMEALRDVAPTIFVGVPRIWEKMYSAHVIKVQESTPLKRFAYRLAIPVGEKVVSLRSQRQQPGFLLRALYKIADFLVFGAIRDQLGLRRAHLMWCGAAPVAPEILKFFNAIGIRVREAYGATEACGLIAIHPAADIRFGTVGKVVRDMEIRIAEDGEILLRGPMIFKGYFKDPDSTAGAWEGGWLHTGDVGVIDAHGHLKIVDRKKDIIITSGGKNIAPQEIENKLKVSPYVKDAIVIGDKRKYITALIEIDYENVGKWAENNGIPYTTFKDLSWNPKTHELIQDVVDQVNKGLAQVETIKKFTLLAKQLDQDDEELTATQKVRRKIVEEKYKEIIDAMY